MAQNWRYSSRKAKRELRYRTRPLERTLGARGEVVRRQSVELPLVGHGRAHVVVHRALECQAELGDLVLQRLDLRPRGVVLVHAGEAVLEQGVLEIVPGARVRGRGHRGERPVDRLVQAERRIGGIRGLGERLRLVAQLLGGTHAIQHAGLCDREHELVRRIIVRTQGIAHGARTLHGQQAPDIGVGAAQALVHPRLEGPRVVARLPGVQLRGG